MGVKFRRLEVGRWYQDKTSAQPFHKESRFKVLRVERHRTVRGYWVHTVLWETGAVDTYNSHSVAHDRMLPKKAALKLEIMLAAQGVNTTPRPEPK